MHSVPNLHTENVYFNLGGGRTTCLKVTECLYTQYAPLLKRGALHTLFTPPPVVLCWAGWVGLACVLLRLLLRRTSLLPLALARALLLPLVRGLALRLPLVRGLAIRLTPAIVLAFA